MSCIASFKSALKTNLFSSGLLIAFSVCVKLCAIGFVRVCFPATFQITSAAVFNNQLGFKLHFASHTTRHLTTLNISAPATHHSVSSHHLSCHTAFHVTPFHIIPPLHISLSHYHVPHIPRHISQTTFNVATRLASDHHILHYDVTLHGSLPRVTISHTTSQRPHNILLITQPQSTSHTIPHPPLTKINIMRWTCLWNRTPWHNKTEVVIPLLNEKKEKRYAEAVWYTCRDSEHIRNRIYYCIR